MPKRGGAKVSGCRSGLIAPQSGACKARHVAVGVIIGIACALRGVACVRVPAVRRNGCSGRRRRGSRDRISAHRRHAHGNNDQTGDPTSIFNFGFADRWELVLQGTAQPLPEGIGPISVSDAAFLKYVVQPGVLQEKSGPSIATEFGPLLPASGGGSGVGFGLTGIVSQRWDWGTVHLNVASNLTPDQHGELFLRCHHRGTEQMESPASF